MKLQIRRNDDQIIGRKNALSVIQSVVEQNNHDGSPILIRYSESEDELDVIRTILVIVAPDGNYSIYEDMDVINNILQKKQNKLIEGNGISISGDTISIKEVPTSEHIYEGGTNSRVWREILRVKTKNSDNLINGQFTFLVSHNVFGGSGYGNALHNSIVNINLYKAQELSGEYYTDYNGQILGQQTLFKCKLINDAENGDYISVIAMSTFDLGVTLLNVNKTNSSEYNVDDVLSYTNYIVSLDSANEYKDMIPYVKPYTAGANITIDDNVISCNVSPSPQPIENNLTIHIEESPSPNFAWVNESDIDKLANLNDGDVITYSHEQNYIPYYLENAETHIITKEDKNYEFYYELKTISDDFKPGMKIFDVTKIQFKLDKVTQGLLWGEVSQTHIYEGCRYIDDFENLNYETLIYDEYAQNTPCIVNYNYGSLNLNDNKVNFSQVIGDKNGLRINIRNQEKDTQYGPTIDTLCVLGYFNSQNNIKIEKPDQNIEDGSHHLNLSIGVAFEGEVLTVLYRVPEQPNGIEHISIHGLGAPMNGKNKVGELPTFSRIRVCLPSNVSATFLDGYTYPQFCGWYKYINSPIRVRKGCEIEFMKISSYLFPINGGVDISTPFILNINNETDFNSYFKLVSDNNSLDENIRTNFSEYELMLPDYGCWIVNLQYMPSHNVNIISARSCVYYKEENTTPSYKPLESIKLFIVNKSTSTSSLFVKKHNETLSYTLSNYTNQENNTYFDVDDEIEIGKKVTEFMYLTGTWILC